MNLSGRHVTLIAGALAMVVLFALAVLAVVGSAGEQPELTAVNAPLETPTLTPEATATPAPPAPTVVPTPVASPTLVFSKTFDGSSAFTYLEQQMAFGARWPGSDAHALVGDYIVETLAELGWAVEEQRFPYLNVEGRNIIGRANGGKGQVIILGAHYDTRRLSDRSPDSADPVPGAVDGASGVAVLLELAASLDLNDIEHEIWLAFFDLEDNGRGGLPGFEWIVGSSFMAQNLAVTPRAMVLVDMVGDADQQLYYEGNSDPELRAELWRIAAELGYGEQFIPEERHTVIDDHLPFARAGIPAVDIIDFDYPYWHTVEDTVDKASPESLARVGRVLEFWLEERLSK